MPEAERTEILRAVAAKLVDLRALYITMEGAPDWGGRSYAYRQTVGEIYGEANIPKEERSSLRAAVAYHIGNILRERLSSDDLETLGLRSLSPRGRSVEKREKQSAAMSMFRTGPAISTPEEALHALTAARALLARVPSEAVAGLKAADKRAVTEALGEVEEEAARLSGAARGRGRRKAEE